MFKISSNGIITVNRGDSFELPVIINIGSSLTDIKYKLNSTDVLYLGIMEPNQTFENAILRKKITQEEFDDNNSCIRFWPDDTLFLSPGKYYYQLKLQTVDSKTKKLDVETVIDKTLFYIQE